MPNIYVKLVFFFPISGSLWEKMFKLEIEIEGRKIGSKHTVGAHRRGWVGWKGVRFETFCHITSKIRNHLDSLAIPSTPLKRNQVRPGFQLLCIYESKPNSRIEDKDVL